jgi:uncharacterized protein (TIRG00374 family)
LIALKKSNHSRVLTTLLRVFIGIALILFLLWRFDFNKILGHVRNIDITYLLYALALYLLFVIISAWRWQVLLDCKKFGLSFWKTLVIYFIALFANNFLPTTVGGDVMRVLYAKRERKTDALATVLVDRMLGFVGLFVFALFAVLYLLFEKKQTEFLPFTVVGLAIILFLTYIVFSERIYALFSPVVLRINLLRLGERLNRLHETATEFGGAWRTITLCVVQSVVIQALLALGPFFVLRGMANVEVGVLPFFIYVPIINVLSMIPISFNATGVREYFYVLLFSRVGLAGDTSLAVSLVSFILVVALSLLGGVAFVFYKRE